MIFMQRSLSILNMICTDVHIPFRGRRILLSTHVRIDLTISRFSVWKILNTFSTLSVVVFDTESKGQSWGYRQPVDNRIDITARWARLRIELRMSQSSKDCLMWWLLVQALKTLSLRFNICEHYTSVLFIVYYLLLNYTRLRYLTKD